MEKFQHVQITDSILCCYYSVYNELGYGFLEKVYENALKIELEGRGLEVVSQKPISVCYRGRSVGEYFCDLVVNKKVIVELKATRCISDEHEAQLLNYLKATNIEVGLVLNFGPKPQVRRKVYANHRKG